MMEDMELTTSTGATAGATGFFAAAVLFFAFEIFFVLTTLESFAAGFLVAVALVTCFLGAIEFQLLAKNAGANLKMMNCKVVLKAWIKAKAAAKVKSTQ